LETELGFSPKDLALQVCASWFSSDTECHFKQYLDDREFCEKKEDLFHLCLLGEVLSNACFPQYYTANEHVLADAFTQLDILGGALLISQVQRAFERVVETLHTGDIEMSEGRTIRAMTLAEYWKPRHEHHESQFAKNVSEFSALLRYERETRRLIHLFMSELVPSAGFQSAAIFSYFPEEMKLVRRASYGDLARGIDAEIVCETFAGEPGFIELAFESSKPLVQFVKSSSGEPVSGCAVSFGGAERFGVLYLEFPDIVADAESEALVLDQAETLKRVLEDSLVVAYL
jgi:hypothetical protein